MKLYIKYMVSLRCKMMLKAALDTLGLQYGTIDLGELEIKGIITDIQRKQLKDALQQMGLELMEDHRAILIEKIRHVIIEMIHYADDVPNVKNSVYISEKLHYDYTYLANLFSESTGTTIEHYIITHKIERAKELLLYNELNLTEIAYKLNYSSVAHLSNQFKKITGLTPTFYKQLKSKKRQTLDHLDNNVE